MIYCSWVKGVYHNPLWYLSERLRYWRTGAFSFVVTKPNLVWTGARLRSPLNSGQVQMGFSENGEPWLLLGISRFKIGKGNLQSPQKCGEAWFLVGTAGSTQVSMVSSKEWALVRGPFAVCGKMLQLSAMVPSKAKGCPGRGCLADAPKWSSRCPSRKYLTDICPLPLQYRFGTLPKAFFLWAEVSPLPMLYSS